MVISADSGAHAMSAALMEQWNCDYLSLGKDPASCSAWVLRVRNYSHGCDSQCPHKSASGTHLRQGGRQQQEWLSLRGHVPWHDM